MRRIWILVLLLFLSFSCESTQKNERKNTIDGEEVIPRNFKTIYIHNFENNTYEGGLGGPLKDYLILEFSQGGRFLLETNKEEAQLLMYGSIDLFSMQPRHIDQFGEPQTYNLTIIVTMWIRENAETENPALPDKKIVRFDTAYSPRIAPFESRQSAVDRLLAGLAARIHVAAIKGWYSELKTPEELAK